MCSGAVGQSFRSWSKFCPSASLAGQHKPAGCCVLQRSRSAAGKASGQTGEGQPSGSGLDDVLGADSSRFDGGTHLPPEVPDPTKHGVATYAGSDVMLTGAVSHSTTPVLFPAQACCFAGGYVQASCIVRKIRHKRIDFNLVGRVRDNSSRASAQMRR